VSLLNAKPVGSIGPVPEFTLAANKSSVVLARSRLVPSL
jgi:hypothetical protein